MATLEVRRLTKVYPTGECAVDDVDLDVGDGELVVVVGPSGCGKSTLLRMIAGLEQPTSGDVLIDGERVNAVTTRRRDIAMAFQSGALYPNMTVAANLGFPLMLAGHDRREIDRRVADVASLLHLDDVLDRRPHRLSGGQRQRVAMGRSIIRNPRLFLMDEPLANLDTKLRIETRSATVVLQRRLGATTVFVTHDQVEAMAMADRLAVMRGGRIVQTGPPMEVYRHPVDLFVATFLGSPPMGVVLAHAASHGPDGAGLAIGRQWLPWPGLGLDGAVALGIRPEALRVDPHGPLVASAVGLDDLGHELVVRLALTADRVRVDDAGVVVDTDVEALVPLVVGPTSAPDPWRPLRLAVDTDLLHLFDLDDGRAITHRAITGRATTGAVITGASPPTGAAR